MPSVGSAKGNGGSQPTFGVAGQLLVKNTTTDYDTTWATVSPVVLGPYYQSGYWYDQRLRWNTTVSTSTSVANTTLYLPITFSSSVTITSMALWMTSATAAAYSLGVSACTSAGLPGTLLASATGTTSGVANSAQVLTFGTPLALTPNWYFFSIGTPTSAITWQTLGAGQTIQMPAGQPAPSAAGQVTCYRDQLNSGVPRSDPPPTGLSTSLPIVYYRVQ
jgi:hypothetical protein